MHILLTDLCRRIYLHHPWCHLHVSLNHIQWSYTCHRFVNFHPGFYYFLVVFRINTSALLYLLNPSLNFVKWKEYFELPGFYHISYGHSFFVSYPFPKYIWSSLYVNTAGCSIICLNPHNLIIISTKKRVLVIYDVMSHYMSMLAQFWSRSLLFNIMVFNLCFPPSMCIMWYMFMCTL